MKERFKELFTVVAYGCVWGLLELTLGGYLHFIHFPQKGFIMGALAYTILTMYVIKYSRVFSPLAIGFIAAGFKILNIFIFNVPIFSRSIVNPALAIIAEAASVTFVAFVVSRFVRLKAAN